MVVGVATPTIYYIKKETIMAKKKEIKKKTPIKLSKEVTCKCGKEWERTEVMEDKTIHTENTYTFRFLGKYTLNTSKWEGRGIGYKILLKLTACPDCREVTRKTV